MGADYARVRAKVRFPPGGAVTQRREGAPYNEDMGERTVVIYGKDG